MKHRSIVSIPTSVLLDIIHGDVALEDGIPKDAKHVATYYDHARDCFDLVMDHPSFPTTPEGCQYLRINPTWRTLPPPPSVSDLLAPLVMQGVRELGEESPVNYEVVNGRPVVKAFVDSGHNATSVDLLDLIVWLKRNRPELLA